MLFNDFWKIVIILKKLVIDHLSNVTGFFCTYKKNKTTISVEENTTLKNWHLYFRNMQNMNKEDQGVVLSTSTKCTVTGIEVPGRVQKVAVCAAQSLIGAVFVTRKPFDINNSTGQWQWHQVDTLVN